MEKHLAHLVHPCLQLKLLVPLEHSSGNTKHTHTQLVHCRGCAASCDDDYDCHYRPLQGSAVLSFEACVHDFAQLPLTQSLEAILPLDHCQSSLGLVNFSRFCECTGRQCLLLTTLPGLLFSVCCWCRCCRCSFLEMTPTWPSVIYVISQLLLHCSCPCSSPSLLSLSISLSPCPPYLCLAQSSSIGCTWSSFSSVCFSSTYSSARPLARSTSGHYIEAISFGTHTYIHHQLGSFLIYWAMSSLTAASAYPPFLPFSSLSLFFPTNSPSPFHFFSVFLPSPHPIFPFQPPLYSFVSDYLCLCASCQ